MFGNKKLDKILKNQEKMMKEFVSIKNSIAYLRAQLKKDENTENTVEKTEKTEISGAKSTSGKKRGRPRKNAEKKEEKVLNFEKPLKYQHLALPTKGKKKFYPIEYSMKNKTDMSLKDFAKVLGVRAHTLRLRLVNLEKSGCTWVNNDNFIYYIRKPGTNYLVKMLTKPAQDYILNRYGKGILNTTRPKRA